VRGPWQCRAEARTWALLDAVRATKKSSKQVASGTTAEKGAADKDKPTTNRNLAQGKESNAVRTATSYFDPVWNTFSKHTDGSMQWIPKQIVAIGEDFHSQVGEGKVRTTLYKVRWEGYDKKDDTWEPITHLQGYATMVKAFKESHAKDVEKLAADRVREAEKKAKDNAASTPKHTVLSMAGLTSAVWTLGMFEMVSGESCQCIHRTKQKNPCDVAVRHAACTVPTCGFVVRYQNTSNLEQHYIRGGLVLSRTLNAPSFTAEKKASVRKASFSIGLVLCQGTIMSTTRTLTWCIFQLENSMMLSRKKPWTRPWKVH